MICVLCAPRAPTSSPSEPESSSSWLAISTSSGSFSVAFLLLIVGCCVMCGEEVKMPFLWFHAPFSCGAQKKKKIDKTGTVFSDLNAFFIRFPLMSQQLSLSFSFLDACEHKRGMPQRQRKRSAVQVQCGTRAHSTPGQNTFVVHDRGV